MLFLLVELFQENHKNLNINFQQELHLMLGLNLRSGLATQDPTMEQMVKTFFSTAIFPTSTLAMELTSLSRKLKLRTEGSSSRVTSSPVL